MLVLIRLAIVWALISGPAWNALAQDGPSVDRGRTLLEANCAGCHATGKAGESPLAQAPLFRKLNQKYPLENLSEALAEGIMTGHPAMPQFVFSAVEIDAILAYLNSISER